MNGDADFVSMVEKTNLYNKVGHVPKNFFSDNYFFSNVSCLVIFQEKNIKNNS